MVRRIRVVSWNQKFGLHPDNNGMSEMDDEQWDSQICNFKMIIPVFGQ